MDTEDKRRKADCDLEIARLDAEEKLEPLLERNKLFRTPEDMNKISDIVFLKNGHYEIKGGKG